VSRTLPASVLTAQAIREARHVMRRLLWFLPGA